MGQSCYASFRVILLSNIGNFHLALANKGNYSGTADLPTKVPNLWLTGNLLQSQWNCFEILQANKIAMK
jgi:hypothetical protein